MFRKHLALLAALVALTGSAFPAPAAPEIAGGALASPNVEFIANIPELSGIGAKIIGDLMYATSAQGLQIYDISLGIPIPHGLLEIPHLQNEDVDTNGSILLIAADQFIGAPNLLYVVDVSSPRTPLLLAPPLSVSAAHTATCINDCSYAWLGGDSNRIVVVDLRVPTAPRQVGTIPIPGYVHDVQVDEAGIAWVSTGGGLFAYTTANPLSPVPVASDNGSLENQSIIHNSLRPNASAWQARTGALDDSVRAGELVMASEEDWLAVSNGQCAQDGVFQTARYTDALGVSRVEKLDTYHLERGAPIPEDRKQQGVVSCSSHYFSHRADGIVAVGWYEQGTRFLDVSDPRNIRSVGYFLPALGEAFAAYWNGDYVYSFDTYRGLDVLKFNGTAGAATIEGPIVSVSRPQRAPDPRFGGLCRIAA